MSISRLNLNNSYLNIMNVFSSIEEAISRSTAEDHIKEVVVSKSVVERLLVMAKPMLEEP